MAADAGLRVVGTIRTIELHTLAAKFQHVTTRQVAKIELDIERTIDHVNSHAGLLDAAVGDRLYWLAMPVATDYYAIAQAAPAAVTLVNGQMTVIAASPSPVPQRCVNVQSGEGTNAAMKQADA